MNFQDIFKKAFLENVQQLSIADALISMAVALALGAVVFLTYQFAFSGVVYSKNYSISLMVVTMVTSIIVITLATNIVLSLGMVGALSIVRFRTAIKEPMDVVYMFWAITIGIVCGARLYLYAIAATLVVAAVFILMRRIKHSDDKYVMVINCDKSALKDVQEILDKTRYVLRSKVISKNDIELVIELDIRKEQNAFVNRISELDQVHQVSLVNYKTSL